MPAPPSLMREILQPQAISNSNPAIAPDFLPGTIGAYMKVKLAGKIARLDKALNPDRVLTPDALT